MTELEVLEMQPPESDSGASAPMPRRQARQPALRTLRHEGRLLPNVSLHGRGPLVRACRERFDGRSLREAAEYVCDCTAGAGRGPDDLHGLLASHVGTIGAKQALLAALAAELGRHDVRLMVACCEMQLPDMPLGRGESRLRRPHTLPLAVCWLRYRGRRLQIVDPHQGSLQTLKLVTEVEVPPEQLAVERVRLYKSYAADWCRALETHPIEFTRLRAWQLRVAAGTSIFEDLLGYTLPADFVPTL